MWGAHQTHYEAARKSAGALVEFRKLPMRWETECWSTAETYRLFSGRSKKKKIHQN